ncbi:MAG: UbiA family prenyltransferase [Puniceicoccales bacterium]|jgi:4-hydroxybenzoate polyprenyltransferase|nr:UbiA family prenyltransferase [Puniceicoccales bacterium]
MKRWWIYQKERFPVFGHGPLIMAFSFSAVCYSSQLRGLETWPAGRAALVAFITSFLSFLHLRIADEFKDFEEDSQYRPYRPVPRGLVKLRELGWLWAITALIQAGLAWWQAPALLGWLALTWLYLALMSREFFVRDWLKARPFTYMWTHMLIMPLIDFYATACDWAGARESVPSGLGWFLATSFFNGLVIEIGRKIRSPDIEENGVPTYSKQWGMRNATIAWLASMAATAFCASAASIKIHFAMQAGILLAVFLSGGIFLGTCFLKNPCPKLSKRIEVFSGIWTLFMYLILGVLPLALRILTKS